jgi:hypothetical protein
MFIYLLCAAAILNFNDYHLFDNKYSTRRFTMLKHIKRLLGIGQAPAETPAPYKVEAPAEVPVSEPALPFPAPKPTKKAATKSAVKTAPRARKPKAPKS